MKEDFSPAELQIIEEMYPRCAHISEVLKMLPNRTWATIRARASILKTKVNTGLKRIADFPEFACIQDITCLPCDSELILSMINEAGENKEESRVYPFWLSPSVQELYDTCVIKESQGKLATINNVHIISEILEALPGIRELLAA